MLAARRLFISYPRGGAAHTWAEKLHAFLRDHGATVWRDETGIPEGDPDWYNRIEDGLRRAGLVLFVLGQDTEACRWQKREMLRADLLGLPVLVCRVSDAPTPLYAIERSPVDLRDASAWATLPALVLQHCPAPPVTPQAAPAGARRQRELRYLDALLSGEFSTHEQRYVPVAGEERAEPTLARTHKGLRIDATAVLDLFGQRGMAEGGGPFVPPTPYADVLDAYRGLPARPVRRLAVLGEPGAGKSFSLERIAVDHARQALHDAQAPLPVLVRLGLWTRDGQPLQALVEKQMGELGPDFEALRDERRLVLLLDGLNEVPPGQRGTKTAELRRMAEDERFAAVLVSCRARDFQDEFQLPFDRLALQPLTPPQVHRFLHRAYQLNHGDARGAELAEARFWALAAGAAGADALRDAWQAWQQAGASFAQFWTANEVPRENPNVFGITSGAQDSAWRAMRGDARSLLHLAANPYVLTVLALLPELPRNRAQLFDAFLMHLHNRERKARDDRHDAASVPPPEAWRAALVDMAEALQHAGHAGTEDAGDAEAASQGAATSLPRSRWPSSMDDRMRIFSIDASVLQQAGDDLRFTHQLLQEALASRVLLGAARASQPPASRYWPEPHWWRRTGWEVVAELAAEGCGDDLALLFSVLEWLARAQPEVASQAWQRAGAPALPPALAAGISARWLERLTDAALEPDPRARAAIGRALATFGLDHRPGVGLTPAGLPDIAWVRIADGRSFIYQGRRRRALPPFEIARYPVTHAQFQAFVDADGYGDDRWWLGLSDRPGQPWAARWPDANAPRETVSWHEAMAFCRWLGHCLGCTMTLPTEQQWERAAAGTEGREYPWGAGFEPGRANGVGHIGRTTAVGMYPDASGDGVHDLAGNVWEWCLNEYDKPSNVQPGGNQARVLRGGSWGSGPESLRAAYRLHDRPGGRYDLIGFRVCRASPI